MKQFTSIPEAFKWWLTNIYPSLPAEEKKGKLVNAWRDYTHKGSISETRMKEVLTEYGHFEIHTIVKYKP